MADHLLQMHILQKRRVLFADVDPLFDHLVEHFGLLARLVAHTHCIVHGDDGDHTGHSKNSRADSLAAGCGNDHRADCRAVGTGHTAVAPHPLELELAQQDKVDDGLEHLCNEPAHDGNSQYLVDREQFFDKLHSLFTFLNFIAIPQPTSQKAAHLRYVVLCDF